jgi:Bacterial transcriptional activator domain
LRPLGLVATARRLPKATAIEIAGLLYDAADPGGSVESDETTLIADEHEVHQSETEPGSPAANCHGSETLDVDEPAEDEAIEPSLLVRVLGVPAVEGCPNVGRIELNLVTFLACSGRSATESQVIDAVWNGRAIERATLWNRTSRAHAALAGHIPPRDQGTNVVRLAPGVMTDLQLLQRAIAAAREESSAQAIDHLSNAMDLVTGVPFDAVGYDWAHEQQHYAEACELIERAALLTVDLALDSEDVATARHVVSQALKALRANEPLYRARMRIEAHCGNQAGVQAAYDELALVLSDLDGDFGTYAPCATTTALLERLVRGEVVRAA